MSRTSSRSVAILNNYQRSTADIPQRFCNEVRACSLLHHTDVEVVPFLGIYSTEARPFCLVYEHMGCLDVRQYLRNEPDISARLKLVLVPFAPAPHWALGLTSFGDSWRILLKA